MNRPVDTHTQFNILCTLRRSITTGAAAAVAWCTVCTKEMILLLSKSYRRRRPLEAKLRSDVVDGGENRREKYNNKRELITTAAAAGDYI